MSTLYKISRNPRLLLVAALLVIACLTPLAFGQLPVAKPAAGHFEYVHQEIQTDILTRSLNDLDAQGWEVFQVVPSWQVKSENGETLLAARAYEVFGRRPVAPK